MFVFEAWLIYNAPYYGGLKSNICIPNRFWSTTVDLHKRDIPSAGFAGGKAPYDVLFSNFANFHLRCWFLHPANCLQKPITSTENKDIKCHATFPFVLIREPHVVFLGKNCHFSSKFRHIWYQKKPKKPSLLSMLRAGETDDHCLFSQRANYKFMYDRIAWFQTVKD